MQKAAISCGLRKGRWKKPALLALGAFLIAACRTASPITSVATTATRLPASLIQTGTPVPSVTPFRTTAAPPPTTFLTLTPSQPAASAVPGTNTVPLYSEGLGGIYNFFQLEIFGYKTVKTTSGKVASGGTAEERVLIDSTIGQAMFSLFWQGSDLDFILIQPDGSIIDPQAAEDDPWISFSSDTSYKFYRVDAPQSGEWILRIKGLSTAPGGEEYAVSILADDAMIFYGTTDKPEYHVGSPIKMSVFLEDSFLDVVMPTYIYDADISVVAQDPAQNLSFFNLYDDGRHSDGEADDGIYANIFRNTFLAGSYNFYLTVSGRNFRADEPFTREFLLSASVTEAPEEFIFLDGFDSGYLSAWSSWQTDGGDLSVDWVALGTRYGLQSQIDDVASIYVQDDSPESEGRYYAGFLFEPKYAIMAEGDSLAIFSAYSAGRPPVVKVALGWCNGGFALQAGAFEAVNGYRVSPIVFIDKYFHAVELYWQAASGDGAGDGQFIFWMDGVEYANFSDIDNETQRVEYVRMGAVSGVDIGTSGSLQHDTFESRRLPPESLLGEGIRESVSSYVSTDGEVQATCLWQMMDDFLEY